MAITRLGWDIYSSYSDPHLINFPWVSGKVRKGDHYVVLDYLARRFNAEVEKIIKASSWGFSPRPVRGFSGIPSEHSAAIALDFNAPQHGIGKVGTFSNSKESAIHRILRDMKGAVRWGGDYGGRKDEMHFELQGGNRLIGQVADLIRAGKLPGAGAGAVKPAGTVKPKTVKANSGNSRLDNIAIAELLNDLGYKAGVPDGVPGPYLKAGVLAYQRAQRYYPGMKPDGDWGEMTQDHFEWVRDVLQPMLNKWDASQRVSILKPDGDYAALTERCVKACQTDNYAAYKNAGGYYKDGEAGPVTCKFLGIRKHPSA